MPSNENRDRREDGAQEKRTVHRKKRKRKREILTRNLGVIGAVLSLVQAATAALFIYLLNGTGMIPWKYVMIAFAVLAALVLLVILLVSIRNKKTRIAAVVVSILMAAVQLKWQGVNIGWLLLL